MLSRKNWIGILLMVLVLTFGMTVVGCGYDSKNNSENGGEGPNTHGGTFTSNRTGKHNGYDFEFWTDSRGAGSGSMTLTGAGTFECKWTNTFNILFRMGKKYNETQRHTQIGTFTLEYGFSDYEPVGTSYVTVYGWTVEPLVEFYIVENWGPNNYKGGGGPIKATVTIDDGVYDIYESTRINQPSIKGNRTFQQYWSIRRNRRTEGTISISEHFKAWEAAGLNMNGRMYEVAFCVEAYGGNARNASGSANVFKNKLMVNGVEINAR